jgi:hypothetical protein
MVDRQKGNVDARKRGNSKSISVGVEVVAWIISVVL